mmetsp:Transcript_13814/g.47689  ORF Transcript_13814/g.47689 Transcript_13814/m.47689 type:complete len:235 (+) Transcript_13814:156-860(+)
MARGSPRGCASWGSSPGGPRSWTPACADNGGGGGPLALAWVWPLGHHTRPCGAGAWRSSSSLSYSWSLPPVSWYSARLMAAPGNSGEAANCAAPRHAHSSGSGSPRTPTSTSLGASARSSRVTRSSKPGSLAHPPTRHTLLHSRPRMSRGHASTACHTSSAAPAWSSPMSRGLRSASGTMKRSFASGTACSSPPPACCGARPGPAARLAGVGASSGPLSLPRVSLTPSGSTYSA